VAENTQMFDSLDLEMRHFAHGQAYGHFKHNPTDLSLGVSTDAYYQNYYSTLAPVQSRREVDFADFVVAGEYDSAQAVLNQYSTAQLWEQNLSTVEQIWLNYLATDSVISTNDSLILYDIACQDPIVGGTGVYSARVILNWDGNCPNYGARSNEFVESVTSASNHIQLFPVPSQGDITVKSEKMIETIQIIDLNGQLLSIFENVNSKEIELKTGLSAGVYLISVFTEETSKEILRFVVE
jgi:hypothetical protein